MARKKQPTFAELFTVGDVVEVAHAPRDGVREHWYWMAGRVAGVGSQLTVAYDRKGGSKSYFQYPRADYNRGLIRKGRHEVAAAAVAGVERAVAALRSRNEREDKEEQEGWAVVALASSLADVPHDSPSYHAILHFVRLHTAARSA